MTRSQILVYIVRLPCEQKLWLLVFTTGSFLVWLALKIIPLRKLSNLFGHHIENRKVCMLATDSQIKTARRMGQLMSMVGNKVPWPSKCLGEAICIKWLLNRYNIPSVLYLGAKISGSLQAHAWVDVAQRTVIGAPQHRQYQTVASFITPAA